MPWTKLVTAVCHLLKHNAKQLIIIYLVILINSYNSIIIIILTYRWENGRHRGTCPDSLKILNYNNPINYYSSYL